MWKLLVDLSFPRNEQKSGKFLFRELTGGWTQLRGATLGIIRPLRQADDKQPAERQDKTAAMGDGRRDVNAQAGRKIHKISR